MSGPDPNPNRRHRATPVKVATLVVLPAEGRRGPIPKPRTSRPLGPVALDFWRTIWRSPQATRWHVGTAVYPLTRLVVLLDMAETAGEWTAAWSAESRALAKAFGLSPDGMRSLNWTIGEPEEPSRPSRAAEAAADQLAAARARRRRIADAADPT